MTNEELLNEINKLKADLAKLSQKLDNKQGRVAARVSELEDDTKKYKNQIANLDSANDNKKERIAGLERKLDTKQGRMVERVKSLEGVVDEHTDEIAEHVIDERHTDVPSRSKLFLMKGSINRVNNAWRRLSFDGNYAMEMEDWSFTSASGHKGLRPSETGFYDIDLSLGLESSSFNSQIISQSVRIYKMSVSTDQVLGILAKTINTSSIRGEDAPTISLSVKNVYLKDDEFILVVAKIDDAESNLFRFVDGTPETTHLSLELKYAHVLEGLDLQEPDVEIPDSLCLEFEDYTELSGVYNLAPNTHQGVAYWKNDIGHYIHYSGEKDTWVITSPSNTTESWVMSTMTPVQDAPSWPWTGSWVTENSDGELIDSPRVAYGECQPTPTPTPTPNVYETELSVPAPMGFVALYVAMDMNSLMQSFPVGTTIIISPGTEIEEVHVIKRYFPLIIENPLVNSHPVGSRVITLPATPTPTTGSFYEKTPTPTTGSFYEKTLTSYAEAINKLNEHQLRWNSLNITEYKFEFEWKCYCSAEYTTPVILHVRDNEIIDVEWANASENDAELVNPDVEKYHTISELFSFTSEYYAKKPYTMDVKFDDDHQFVTEMYADVEQNIADEEMGFVASNLQVIVG